MYYSAIGLLALLILLIENYGVILKRNGAFEKPAWNAYRRFLLAVLVYYITDILWGILESCKLATPLFADTTVFFVAMGAGVLLWVQYIVAYLGEKNVFGQFLVHAGRLIALVIAALSFVNIFTPVLFTVDRDSVYTPLPMRYVILGVQILLLLLISAYALSSLLRQPSEKRPRYRTLALFGLIMAVFLFVQLWYPLLPLYTIAYLLGTCLLHAFVLNDEREEYRRGLEEASRSVKMRETIATLLDNMPGMTFTKDAETGVYLACNQAFADYAHKASPEGVAGLTDVQIFDAGTAAHFAEDDRMALSMEEPYIFFEDVLDGAGNRRQFQTTKQKYIDTAGRLCVLGMCQDVTDLVRIQRENATTKESYEKARSTGIIFSRIARTLARSYTDLYYVNVDTEEYIEYRTDDNSASLTEARRGWHFFEECQLNAEKYVYPEDREAVRKALDRKTLTAALDRNRSFVITYRLLHGSGYRYVTLKVSRMVDDERYLILGVTDVDEQMKQRRAAERMQEEQIAYARLSALTGDFLSVYLVAPETGRYREFSAAGAFEAMPLAKEGMDFFRDVRRVAHRFVCADDLNRFFSSFTAENVIAEIERGGIYTLSFRLVLEDKPRYVQMKAAMVEEADGARMIVGVNDIDAQVRQEEAYVKNLAQARIEASVDALTGVKNRYAYLEAEEKLNAQLAENPAQEFAIVVLDVNDLKKVNDTIGHEAGDEHIRSACRIICETFKRSPVFRIGGDEFVVIAQGSDYGCIGELVESVRERSREAQRSGGVVIACGMSINENDGSVASVFERADQEMYGNKSALKGAPVVRA